MSNYSLITKKMILGVSGLVLFGFVVGHLLGNLSVFAGQDAINSYAHFLHKNPLLVYSTRVVLLINVSLHIYLSISITYTNRSANQRDYAVKNYLRTTFAASSMIYSGLIILAFIVYHLLHLTFGVLDTTHYGVLDDQNRFDVYTMLMKNLSKGYVALIYLTGLTALALHLSHALFSVCQTFSLIRRKQNIVKFQNASSVISVTIITGYMMIPITIFIGLIS
jgi:succinate dehydrogenase / fumarate reductase cytochrome b subunit